MKRFNIIALALLLCASMGIAQFQHDATPIEVQLSDREDGLAMNFTAQRLDPSLVSKDGATFQAFTIPGEGTTFSSGKPILPAISRFVIVNPVAGLEYISESDEPVRIKAQAPPALCDDDKLAPSSDETPALYPPNYAEFTDPVIIRGVRMVKVTTYPYQYDSASGEFLYRRNIKTDIRYNDDPPVNPVEYPDRPHRSREFRKFIREFAVNGSDLVRDDPDYPTDHVGHYLVVAHTSALLWHLPFIEWRRKAGYKMDIIALSANDATNTNAILNAVSAKYQEYVRAGEEPFDELLFIGDRNGYDNLTVAPNFQLAAPTGETIWGGPNHADYKLALLDGNDNLPDVSFGRFPSGSQGVAALVVGRTLAYEMNPRMQNPQWFTRGLNYSQHWGNTEWSAWHVTIHTNARWGEEVLKSLGFDDVNFYENDNFGYEQNGERIGPVIRDELNAGSNLLVGRAENYFWRNNFQGVQNNTVFPINICYSGHGEWTAWNMFRTGDGNNLKGPVAATFGWGGPPTAPSSYLWMQMVNGTLLKEMSLGWSRLYAITSIERYFPNEAVQPNNRQLYDHVKTDCDMHGDPGIHPWFGVPRLLQLTVPQTVAPDVGSIEARVTSADDEPQAGVQVTLYHPGNMPFDNAANYASYTDFISKIGYTDAEGVVRFTLDENFIAAKPVYITATGRDIKPVLGEIAVAAPRASVVLSDHLINEIDGNGDEVPNPSEIIDVTLIAKNNGNRDAVANVRATVTSLSPFLTVEENSLSFGNIAAGQEAEGDAPIRVQISPRCPDAESRPLLQPQLLVTFNSGEIVWKSVLNIPTSAPHFQVRSFPGGTVIQTQMTNFDIDLNNVGSRGSGILTGRLVSQGIGITIIRESAVFPAIASGSHARIQGNVFQISGNQIAVPGATCPMVLYLNNEAGFSDTVRFTLQVSTPRANAPQGPDAYGYIAFDDTDQDWDIAPVYDWEEINPNDNNAEYEGTRLNFNWQSPSDIGEALLVNLGFETQFYGRRYNRITVATNGFISMGNQPRITNHQNWPLDQGIGGGVGMVAPLWDDFNDGQGTGIYTYFDEENARFIVEWYRLRGASVNTEFTFQVILYDADVWHTESGDPNILFQYKTVSEITNIRNGDDDWTNNIPYASVGISSPDGTTGLSYHFNGEGPVTSADLAARRAILFATAPRFKNGVLYGRVTDHATGEPLAGATVFTQHGFAGTSDENGFYRIPGAPAEIDFWVCCRLAGYNDSSYTDQWIDEEDSLEVNFDLLHPEFELNARQIAEVLSPDEIIESPFTLRNNGNGSLNWQVNRRLIGDANASPWELRREVPVTQITGDGRVEGCVFIEDRFYLAGSGSDSTMIWVLDRDGALVDSFRQHGTSRYGYKDLEYDGELIWGAGEARVFGFTPEGRLVKQWNSNLNPASYIAWNSDEGVLYLCGTTTNIVTYDRDGNNLGVVFQRSGRRFYGLGYWSEDPDNYPLYLLNQPDGDTLFVEKRTTDPANNNIISVKTLRALPDGTFKRNGIAITNQYDVYSWVLLTTTNLPPDDGGDHTEIYQLDVRRDWFSVHPTSGTLPPGEEQDFSFTFNSASLPPVLFEGELLFTHNASGGISILPVSLDVQVGPGGIERREISLAPGWNQISLNIAVEENDIPTMMRQLVEAGLLRFMKDGVGRFYRPSADFNNIPRWNPADGYLVYLEAETIFNARGVVIAADEPIQLNAGWNLRSYYPRHPMDARTAVAGIADVLDMVKDGSGRFYLPALDYSNMPPMDEGKGYYFRVNQEIQLVYPAEEERIAKATSLPPEPAHFVPPYVGSPDNHSLLVVGDPSLEGMEIGAVTPGGLLCGSGRFDATGRAGVALWGNDPETPETEGFTKGETFALYLWDGDEEKIVSISKLEGDALWTSGGITIAEMASLPPVEFGLTNAFPNPFNSSVRIDFTVMDRGRVRLAIFDLTGRLVADLIDSDHTTGAYSCLWKADEFVGGVYFARLEQDGRMSTKKLLLVK